MQCPQCNAAIPQGNRFCGQCGTSLAAMPDETVRPAATPVAADAERRQLTVMFCDLAGSTALSTTLDPEDLRDVIAAYQDGCAQVITQFDGFIARYMGDGILVYFGYPQAHEDDAERAVRAGLGVVSAIQILRPRENLTLAVRIGIETGLVVVGDIIGEGAAEERAVLGETPNLAARLQGLAEPNSVVIGPGTRHLLGGLFNGVDLGAHALKGIPDPVPAWRVVGESAAESRFDAAHDGGLTPFVGRDAEMALLLDKWEQSKTGAGQVVLLSAEAGIGKSRMTQVFREQTEDDAPMRLRFHCSPYHRNSALYPIITQLQRAAGIEADDAMVVKLDKIEALDADNAPLLASLLSVPLDGRYPATEMTSEQRRQQTLEALQAHIASLAATHPLPVLFDDIHWIDPSTRELLDSVIMAAANLPIFLVVTFRPEFEAPWGSLAHVTDCRLRRLSHAQSTAIVENLTGGRRLPGALMQQIIDKTDGVPLFVEELTKTILESDLLEEEDGAFTLRGSLSELAIPSTLQDSLMARLDRLGPAKEVAQIGAAIGRDFSHTLISVVAALDDAMLRDALSHLIGSGLVHVQGTPPGAVYSFKHALVQDVAYESLLRSRRRELHAHIAHTLEEGFPEIVASAPETLAHHFTAGGLAEPAVKYWRRAGERAIERSANVEAIDHLSNGMEGLENFPPGNEHADHQIALQIALAGCMRIVDRIDEALAVLDDVQKLAETHDNVAALARIHYLRGSLYFPLGWVDGCLEEHGLALDYAQRANALESEALALSGLGDAYYARGQMTSAYGYFERCIALCEAHGFGHIESANRFMVGTARIYLNELDGALKDSLDSATLAAAVGNQRAEIVSRFTAGWILLAQDEIVEANAQASRAMTLTGELGAKRFEPFLAESLARVRLAEGDRAGAAAMLEEALRLAGDTGRTFIGPWILGTLALASEDPVRRKEALAEGEAILREGAIGHNYFRFYPAAMEVALLDGDWENAERYAAAFEDYTRAKPVAMSEFYIAWGRSLASFGRGIHDAAVIDALRRLKTEAERIGLKSALPRLVAALEMA